MPGDAAARAGFVVFDLDGTLIDSRQDLADAANATLEAFGLEPVPVDDVARMVGEGAAVLLERAFGARGSVPAPEALAVFLEAYGRRLVVHTRPYQGAVEVVRDLAQVVPVAVLTNKPQDPAERLLEHFGFRPHLAAVIGGGPRFARKPNPSALEFLVRGAGVAPRDAWMVGDSWIDHETASRAGTRCCLARYGFGFEQMPPGRLRGDEWIIDRPIDLLEKWGRESF